MVNLTDDEKLELGIYIEQVIREELQKIIKQEARDISQKIESRVDLETNINTLTNRILAKSKIKGFVESISKTMGTYLRDLDDIKQFRDNIRREIIQSLAEDKENLIKKATEKTDAMIEGQKEIIKGYAHEAYELADFIENTKKRVINEIVSEATKRIEIEDVRPRAIEIYHNGTLEKTLEKELYHQEFETIYNFILFCFKFSAHSLTPSGIFLSKSIRVLSTSSIRPFILFCSSICSVISFTLFKYSFGYKNILPPIISYFFFYNIINMLAICQYAN